MTSAQIVTAVVAAYAAVISTLSLILAVRVHRAANPDVSMSWTYSEPDRKLVVSIYNTGRADITIATVDLYIERRVMGGPKRDSDCVMGIDRLSHIPADRWMGKRKASTFPARLASHSMLSIPVKHDAISLPSQYPLDELYLRIVARFPAKVGAFNPLGMPKGRYVVFVIGDDLRAIAGIDPDRPIDSPIPGSLSSDE